jgi:hypothetical protein
VTRAPRIEGLYHYAHPCRTGEATPYAHLFSEMGDGSYIAFFDLGKNELPAPSPNTTDWVRHFAISTSTVEDVLAMRAARGARSTSDAARGPPLRQVDLLFRSERPRLELNARTEPPHYLREARRPRVPHRQVDASKKGAPRRLTRR